MKPIGIVVIMSVIFASMVQAAEVQCVTKYWGDNSKAEVTASINDQTQEGKVVLVVNDKQQTSSTSKPSDVTRGRYAGYIQYDLGTLKGAGYDGGSLSYVLRLPQDYEYSQDFTGYVSVTSQDGYGSGSVKFQCHLGN